MDNTQNAFFYQIQPISDNSTVFEELTNQQLFFSYFQVDQKYYLFFYGPNSIEINRIDSFIQILHELDTKQRTIRSLRGFFRYALEIMDNGKIQILKTNLQPSFWRKLRKILKQNKKEVLLQFLFGTGYSYQPSSSYLEDQIQTLQNQVNSLQQKVIQLEAKLMRVEQNSKYPLSEPSQPLESSRIIQQGNSTLEVKKGPYLPENDPKRSAVLSAIRNPTYQRKGMESKSVSEASKSPLIPLSESQQYNISSNQDKGLNGSNFITLGKISEEEKIEIIKLGFQLQNQGKISLKKYYESTDPNSLFQHKGYSIKYETIRRTKLYQSLKG